jgi:hypothetical protein
MPESGRHTDKEEKEVRHIIESEMQRVARGPERIAYATINKRRDEMDKAEENDL